MEVFTILRGASFACSAAEYLGLIRSALAAKLDQLAASELEAGMRAIQQASKAEREQDHLLREARSRFNKAISLEKGLRLALTHLGLALCHSVLGDQRNPWQSLEDLLKVEPPGFPIAVTVADKVLLVLELLSGGRGLQPPPMAPVATALFKRETEEERKKLCEIQASKGYQ